MFFANLSILPLYYFWMTFEKALILSPYVAAFNVVHGLLSMLGGYLIYEAIVRRTPYITNKKRLRDDDLSKNKIENKTNIMSKFTPISIAITVVFTALVCVCQQ